MPPLPGVSSPVVKGGTAPLQPWPASGFIATVKLHLCPELQKALGLLYGLWSVTQFARGTTGVVSLCTFRATAEIPTSLSDSTAGLGILAIGCAALEIPAAIRDFLKAHVSYRDCDTAMARHFVGHSEAEQSRVGRKQKLRDISEARDKLLKQIKLTEVAVEMKPSEAAKSELDAQYELLLNLNEQHTATLASHLAAYIAYESAHNRHATSRINRNAKAIALLRDGVFQGGGVGAGLATNLCRFGLATGVDMVAGGATGGVFGILGGAGHIAAGAYTLVTETEALRVAEATKAKTSVLQSTIDGAPEDMAALLKASKSNKPEKEEKYNALAKSATSEDVERIKELTKVLQKHFAESQDHAAAASKAGISVAKWRIVYGVACILTGAALAALFLTGSLLTGGLLLVAVVMFGALASALWMGGAGGRSWQNQAQGTEAHDKDAQMQQKAFEQQKEFDAGKKSWDAVSKAMNDNKFLAVAQIVVALDDRERPLMRKVLKAELIRLGLSRTTISFLKWNMRHHGKLDHLTGLFHLMQDFILGEGGRRATREALSAHATQSPDRRTAGDVRAVSGPLAQRSERSDSPLSATNEPCREPTLHKPDVLERPGEPQPPQSVIS